MSTEKIPRPYFCIIQNILPNVPETLNRAGHTGHR